MADQRRLELPPEFASEIATAGRRVDAALPVDFAEAAAAAHEELELLRVAEQVTDRDLHKGHPLYNLGVTLYPRQPREALRHFEAAFVEDVRTYRAPRRQLAARIMRNLFGVSGRLLGQLVRRALPDVNEDPLAVAEQVQLEVAAGAFEPLFPEDEPDDWLFDVGADELVFVGGSYRSAGDRIFQMADQIAACGLHPVIVGLLKRRPEETDRQKSFRILDMCGLAAFDGSVQERPGWWAELERIVQTSRVPTLVAYFSSRPSSDYRTSAMFPTSVDHPKLVLRPFGRNLDSVVRAWIRDVRGSANDCGDEMGADDVLKGRYVVGSNTPYMARIEPSGYPNLSLPGSAVPFDEPDE